MYISRVRTDKMMYNFTTKCAYIIFFCRLLGVVSGYCCPDGWTTFNGSCYFFGHHDLDFQEAERFCTHYDANLVSIETSSENTFLKSYLQTLKDARHWIGLTDEIIEGVWTWYKTASSATFTDWGSGQPNEGRVANCAAMWAGFKYQWVDEACTHLFKPLCEKRTYFGTLRSTSMPVPRLGQDEIYNTRVLFIMGGMYLLLEGVLSSLMGFRDDLIYRLAAIQVIGGVISLFIYIDYSLFRHFVLCLLWNVLVLLYIVLRLYHVCKDMKDWVWIMPHAIICPQIIIMMILQMYEHWKMYKNCEEKKEKNKERKSQ